MIVSIQTYGDDLVRFHPHLHCLVSDGLFLPDGSFLPTPAPDPEVLMRAFRHRLLKALLARQTITQQMVELFTVLAPPRFLCLSGTTRPTRRYRRARAPRPLYPARALFPGKNDLSPLGPNGRL